MNTHEILQTFSLHNDPERQVLDLPLILLMKTPKFKETNLSTVTSEV